jgi:pyrroloquinoline quinone (PQQ) biosynthesis protein C
MKGSPYKWANYTPKLSKEFIRDAENPEAWAKGVGKELKIVAAKDYLSKHEPKDCAEPNEAYCIIFDLLKIIDGRT